MVEKTRIIYRILGLQTYSKTILKARRRKRGRVRTVTGLSGSCIQKAQLKIPSRTSNTSFFAPFFSSSSAFPLISSCRFFAFSSSVRESSAIIAWIAAINPPDSPDFTAGASPEIEVQSGHSHCTVEERVWGRDDEERQLACHGVTQVLQVSFSSSDGFALQSMQTPSPSHGSWLTCAIAWEKKLKCA